MRPFRRKNYSDRAIDSLSDEVHIFTNQFENKEFLDYEIITGVAIIAGNTTFNHGLGRQPIGWVVVDLTANVGIFRASWDSTSITVTGSGAATAKILVF